MNWLGLIVAIGAALALITAIVFLWVHRKGKDDKPKPDPPPNMNGRARERRDKGTRDERPGGPYRRRRVVPGSWEMKK